MYDADVVSLEEYFLLHTLPGRDVQLTTKPFFSQFKVRVPQKSFSGRLLFLELGVLSFLRLYLMPWKVEIMNPNSPQNGTEQPRL